LNGCRANDAANYDIRLWRAGEIAGRNSELFIRWAVGELEGSRSPLVIDLRRVRYVNAAGLSSIVAVCRFASLHRRPLFWINLDKNVANIIELAGLKRMLEML
jgi:anti-anti-sigma factor